MFNPKITKPKVALAIIFAITLLLSVYGVRDGTFYIFDLLGGIFIYKVITAGTDE
jgi:hypothetical protein